MHLNLSSVTYILHSSCKNELTSKSLISHTYFNKCLLLYLSTKFIILPYIFRRIIKQVENIINKYLEIRFINVFNF